AVAPPYELLAAEQLESPYGKLYLAIAGSTADSVLLTASCFAEPPNWLDAPTTRAGAMVSAGW
ncbi:MAG: hypothetical protein IJ956_09455, partial [Akkermansia sp.]|nr:hypothetical protein [Akkermansia sp.]